MRLRKVVGAPVDFGALRAELQVPGDFSVAELTEASATAAQDHLPESDLCDVPFVTLDPVGSRDLDQALHLSRTDTGYLLQYAIADVAAFIAPGSALDDQSLRRGQTLYFPDLRVPLYPPVISEGAASLLPDQMRPAVIWHIDLNREGAVTNIALGRARMRSRAQLDYPSVQRASPTTMPGAIRLLPEVGRLLLQQARARHAINLDLPEQEVVASAGGWTLAIRRDLPSETYNAQLSLLTGMCAATLMIGANVGLLRTVPDPDGAAVAALRRAARALHVDWPAGASVGEVLARLDRGRPQYVAFVEHAASLLRGAGYLAFEGIVPTPHTHAGVGAAYAHVTAPLRRLADRYATEICLAVYEQRAVPSWVRSRLVELPQIMQHAEQVAHTSEHAVIDATESWLVRDRVGQAFAATVIDSDRHGAVVMIDAPPIRAHCHGEGMHAGQRITARLVTADVATRTVRFERA